MIYWGISENGAAFHRRTQASYNRALCNPLMRIYEFVHPDNVHSALLCRHCLKEISKEECSKAKKNSIS